MSETDIEKLSVIVPCLNEEANCPLFESQIINLFAKRPFSSEFIFVNDGSTDATSTLLEQLKQKHSSVIVEHHERNRGLGAALRTGFTKVTGDAVLTLDSDLTFHPTEADKLMNAYGPEVDGVLGSPVAGHFKGVSLGRRFLSVGVNQLYGFLLGVDLTGVSSIFRLYRSKLLLSLKLSSNSFDINAEIVSKLLLVQANLVEVPVTLTERIYGKSKIRFVREIYNHLRMFLKIIFWRLQLSLGLNS